MHWLPANGFILGLVAASALLGLGGVVVFWAGEKNAATGMLGALLVAAALLVPWALAARGAHEIGSLRRRAEQHEQRYLRLVQACPDAILVHQGGTIVFVNDACVKLLGAESPAQLVGRSVMDVAHPDYHDVIRDRFRQLLEEGRPVPLIEEKLVRLDGTTVEVEVAGVPFLDQGRPAVQAVARDISKRREVEAINRALFDRLSKQNEQLWQSEAKYRALIEATDTGYVIVDAEGRVLDANDEYIRLTGRGSREAVLGHRVTEWTAPHDVERNAAEVSKCTAVGVTAHLEVDYIDAAGRLTPIEINGRLVHTPEGPRIVALCRDITHRKEVERELRDSHERLASVTRQLISAQETERRHLARELHDEVGQVLTAIGIRLEMLRPHCTAEGIPGLDECAAIVRTAVEQVRDLSLNMRPPMLDDFGLATAVRWHLGRLASLRGVPGQRPVPEVHFTAETSGTRLPPELEAACFRVAQEAVTNVLRHARAANVWVALKQDEAGVEVTVRDDGAGFDVATARERAARGGSLGLLGMRERVELLGGTFDIDSAPGRGTEIRLRLAAPTADEEGEP